MAKIPLPYIDPDLQGSLMIKEVRPNYTNVYFLPSEKAISQARIDGNGKTRILEIDAQKNSVCIYPINTFPKHPEFLQPKYDSLETITLHGFGYGHAKTDDKVLSILDDMPPGFIKDYDYGLGFRRERGTLVRILKEWGINHLVISTEKKADINEESSTLILNYTEFEKIHENTELIAGRAQRVAYKLKGIDTNNILSNLLGNPEKYPTQPYPKFQIKAIPKLIAEDTSAIDIPLQPQEQEEANNFASESLEKIMVRYPETRIKVRNDIELVSLVDLIKRYKLMLNKGASEPAWQALFQQNPFILSMVFSSPITVIESQVNVGGVSIGGSGGKIGDFLVANSISYNATIIEIKKPQTPLLSKTCYRKNIYNASTKLSGAINQVLDQRMHFQHEFYSKKYTSEDDRFEDYHTVGAIIIGKMPTDKNKKKSFELFRRNSKDVVIITFDELLEKIKQLLGFLKENTDDTIKN